MDTFRERLLILMSAFGWMPEDLDERLCMEEGTVRRWMDGDEPRRELQAMVAELLGVRVDWLLGFNCLMKGGMGHE
jgi:hypothetical protein